MHWEQAASLVLESTPELGKHWCFPSVPTLKIIIVFLKKSDSGTFHWLQFLIPWEEGKRLQSKTAISLFKGHICFHSCHALPPHAVPAADPEQLLLLPRDSPAVQDLLPGWDGQSSCPQSLIQSRGTGWGSSWHLPGRRSSPKLGRSKFPTLWSRKVKG